LSYEYEWGVEYDVAAALMWYRKAAELGHAAAMTCIGWLAERYVRREDLFPAREWYIKAAELGDIWAMECLGDLHSRHACRDCGQAATWLWKAADAGDACGVPFKLRCLLLDDP
jgi:hypothetical protein